ncbi:MAG: hypothetical protein ACJ8C4_20455 [Gemmataceae bacterium]
MRRLITCVALLSGMSLLVAADPPPTPSDPDGVRKNAAFDQERLRQQFSAFQQSLLSLAQRLEKSNKPEDRDKAAALRQAIDLASREGIDNQFSKLVSTLTAQGVTLRELDEAVGKNEQLTKTLREMIALLLSDNQAAKNKDEQKKLQDMLKALDAVIRAQKIERSKVESGKGDKDALAKGQNKVTKQTDDLAKSMGKMGDKDDPKGDPKKGDPKDGQPKDGQPKDGQPKDGQPKDGQPKDGQPQDGQPQDGQPKDKNQKNEQQDPTRKQVKDATENQRNAEEKINKDDRKGASNEQDEAIKKLEEARKEIERRLKQLREEEMERLLANLENRCNRMLTMQIEVYEGTKRVHGAIQTQPDKKPTRADDQKSGEWSVKEGQIVVEANKTLQLLAEEGSAVAFPLVLEDLREQMKVVQARLFKTDVGSFTQSIEEDIIASLKEMIAALKKAQQDMKDKKDQPPPSGGQPPPQKLIDTLADLKMIRALQVQINNRTKAYAASYPGEQADDADIRKELQGLGQRENKVYKVTKDIATGKTHGQ